MYVLFFLSPNKAKGDKYARHEALPSICEYIVYHFTHHIILNIASYAANDRHRSLT